MRDRGTISFVCHHEPAIAGEGSAVSFSAVILTEEPALSAAEWAALPQESGDLLSLCVSS